MKAKHKVRMEFLKTDSSLPISSSEYYSNQVNEIIEEERKLGYEPISISGSLHYAEISILFGRM